MLCNMFISRVAEALYLQRIEKIDRFQDSSNSTKDHSSVFKMAIPIIDLITHCSPPFLGWDRDRREPRATVAPAGSKLSVALWAAEPATSA